MRKSRSPSLIAAALLSILPFQAWAQSPASKAIAALDSNTFPEGAQHGEATAIAAFPEEGIGIHQWMERNGWESKRNDPRRFEVGGGRLHMLSARDSVLIATERGFPPDPQV